MRPGLAVFLAVAVLPLAACGADADEEWAGPPRSDDGGSLGTEAFNDYLARYGEYARSPVEATSKFLRLDRTNAERTSIVARSTAEGSGPTTVTVTLDRLLDDSVRAQRYVLVFDRDDGEWRLISAVTTQRCWPGRGHQTLSPEPCV